MQALEQHEDALEVFAGDADAVVVHCESPLMTGRLDAQVHHRRLVAAELDRVGQQVLEQLQQLHRVALDGGQIVDRDARAALFDRHAQILERVLHDRVAIGRRERLGLRAEPRVGEQIIDQRLHALGAVDRITDELVGVGVELAPVALRDQLQVARNHAQRLLHVVRRDVGELLELGV